MMMSKPEPGKSSSGDSSKPSASGGDAVTDLERRLTNLGDLGTSTAAAPATTMASAPAFASEAAQASSAGGKNALLARIMAAQERAKQTQPKETPTAAETSDFDLLQMGAPSAAQPPAPSFDLLSGDASAVHTAQTTTTTDPATSFDLLSASNATQSVAPPVTGAAQWEASAPAMGDLMGDSSMMAPGATVPPPAQEESLEDIINAIEGLSEEEKQTLLAEQAEIMANIEKKKPTEASRKADAFESRSFSAAVQSVGGSRTQAGGAGAGSEDVESDMALAMRLQQEEYAQAGQNDRIAAQQKAREKKAKEQGQSWSEWLGLTGSGGKEDDPRASGTPGFAQPRGGLSGDGNSYGGSPPRSGGGGGARVAESKPLFACVADSVVNAANTLQTAMYTDEDGNVHGVDNSSLLAMPPSSQTPNSQYKSMN